jgi:ABC-type sugar transport system ATPase subunit
MTTVRRSGSSAPVLDVRGAVRRFAEVTALDGVSITVEGGELLALLGPSGCGKTTLLRSVAGLERLDEGAIVLEGSDVTRTPPERRAVAMVFQDGGLFPHLTARENIAVAVRRNYRSWRATLRSTRIDECAALVRIERLLERRPSELSGGQRQRVGLARALAANPTLMLMDEPFANLDADLRLDLRREIRRLHRAGDVAETVFVTHDQTEALGIADRIAVMFDGRLAQVGVPDDLLLRPSTLSVARFLGVPRINVLPPVGDITPAIRPSDLSLGAGDGLNLSGIAAAREPFAGNWLVAVVLPGEIEVEAVIDRDSAPGVGETVTVTARPGVLHLFDTTSGARVNTAPMEVCRAWSKTYLGSEAA